MATLIWRRPGMAKKLHAYADGSDLSLCTSWGRGPEGPVFETVAKDDACHGCWNKAQARKYRKTALPPSAG